MKSAQFYIGVIVFFVEEITIFCLDIKTVVEVNDVAPIETMATYSLGVYLDIINPKKYTLESFKRDERTIFKDLYKQYISSNDSQPMNYKDWLVVNNFGILPDTQESLFEKKTSMRNTADNKLRFLNTVVKGDILITGQGFSGWLVGHAAIMSSDDWVLEMAGGSCWKSGINNNNRQISKDKWFDEHASDWTTVYRCPDSTVATDAATWASIEYYNASDGNMKTKHITYSITTEIFKINPSYCSKLVIQAYYFGSGKKKVIRGMSLLGRIVVPSIIPWYFISPYKLVNKGFSGWLVGHAAIMSSDDWVLEMAGGSCWKSGINNNYRQISKDKWFDEHASDWTTVYRCPDGTVATDAATWASIEYYNASDGNMKTKHITYSITTEIFKINPSYCSKLVIQAYYFGSGKKKVIRGMSLLGRIVVPSIIPWYFISPYKLVNKGKF